MGKVKINLTNGELWNLQSAIGELVKTPMREPWFHKVVRLADSINKELKLIQQSHNALIAKYGAKDEDEKSPTKGQVVIKPDAPNRKEFNEELSALMDSPCEMEVQLIEIPPTVELSPAIGLALLKFIDFKDGPDVVAEAEKIAKGEGR